MDTSGLHLDQDAMRLMSYLRVLDEPDLSESDKKEFMFRIGLRLTRIQSEINLINNHLLEQEKADVSS